MSQAAVVAAVPGRSDELLERAGQLAVLKEALASVGRAGRGTVVVICGEAGVGKTALLRSFRDQVARRRRVLWVHLRPALHAASLRAAVRHRRGNRGRARDRLGTGRNPHQVALALARELRSPPPTSLVLEDLHWADEATLDVFTLLVRRAEATPALVVGTCRDDALENAHPLRRVLGELATAGVRRLKLAPLSPEAVGQLAAPHGMDGRALYEKTGGNPFFVVEVLAGGSEEIPADGEGRRAGPRHAAEPYCSRAPRGGGGGAPTSRAVAAGSPGGRRRRGRGRMRQRRHACAGGRRGGSSVTSSPVSAWRARLAPQIKLACTVRLWPPSLAGRATLWTSLGWPTTPRRPGTPTLSSASPLPAAERASSMGAHREAAAQIRARASGPGPGHRSPSAPTCWSDVRTSAT